MPSVRAAVLLAMVLAAAAVAISGSAVAKPGEKTSTMPNKRPPDQEIGERLWKQSCWQCHGDAGTGDGPAAAALIGGVPSLEGKVKGEDFEALVRVVQEGRGRMPAFAEDIDRHDSRRILLYARDVLEGKITPGEAGEEEEGEGEEGDVAGGG